MREKPAAASGVPTTSQTKAKRAKTSGGAELVAVALLLELADVEVVDADEFVRAPARQTEFEGSSSLAASTRVPGFGDFVQRSVLRQVHRNVHGQGPDAPKGPENPREPAIQRSKRLREQTVGV
jgi:hypothetical protein